MIKTVAEFLQKLADVEADRLAKQDIKHPGVIGSMYEGLTKDILSRSLPPQLDLKIVDGFVTNDLGNMSGQIDCMLVSGAGDAVPYVEGTYRWHVKNVLAVFEIKKSLFGADLSDAYDQVKSVADRFSEHIQSSSDKTPINLKPTYRVYAQVTGKVAPPVDQWASLPTDLHLIAHGIMFDQLAPVRIVFGYGGYKTEASLRKGFLKFLEKNLQKRGYGVPSIPNLITANGNTLVKVSGHPFVSPLIDTGQWPILGSTNISPIELILEIIWTRLTYIHNMAGLFGDDLELEVFNGLLLARPAQLPTNEESWGWMYETIEAPQSELNQTQRYEKWEPITLDADQNVIIQQLCNGTKIKITDTDFVDFVTKSGKTAQDFVADLISTRLVALDDEVLELTTIECATIILPDGRYIAGENNSGRLSRWVEAFMREWKKDASA